VLLANVPPHMTVPALLVCRSPRSDGRGRREDVAGERGEELARPASVDALRPVVAVFVPIVTMWFDAISPGSEVAAVPSDVLPEPSVNHAGVEEPVADRNFFMM